MNRLADDHAYVTRQALAAYHAAADPAAAAAAWVVEHVIARDGWPCDHEDRDRLRPVYVRDSEGGEASLANWDVVCVLCDAGGGQMAMAL